MKKTSQNYTNLKPRQLQAIALLTSMSGQYRSIESVAAEVGVTRKTIYNWGQNPEFAKAIKSQAGENFGAYAGKVRAAHLKGIIERQSPALIKLYYDRIEGWPRRDDAPEGGITLATLAKWQAALKKKPVQVSTSSNA